MLRHPHHRPGPLVCSRFALVLSLCACGVSSDLLQPEPEPTTPIGAGGSGSPGGAGGTESPIGAGGSGAPVAATGLPGSVLFADDQILEIRLTLDASDQHTLEEYGIEEEYVPGRATIVGAGVSALGLTSIGVRHKGAYTLRRCWDNPLGERTREDGCEKLSYKLKFDEYDSEQRVDGVKRLNLHAATTDDTRLHELMAYGVFRDFGVDAPRTALAKVYVNEVLEGLFIAVEAIDGRFTKAHFPDGGGDGNLYKEVWPSPLLDSRSLEQSLRTNEELGDVSSFRQFSDAATRMNTSTFRQTLSPWVDVDQLLRYVAVDRALKNWDGIMAFYSPSKPHNFYWYHDVQGSGRFTLIPWDLDNTFWAADPYMAPSASSLVAPVPDWNVEPMNCDGRRVWDASSTQRITPPRCDRLLDELAQSSWSRFADIADELLAGPFDPERLIERARHHTALLDPLVAEDPLLDHAQWRAKARSFEWTLEQAAEDFRAYVAQGLVEESGQ